MVPGTLLEVTCEPGYEKAGAGLIRCRRDGSLSHQPATCIPAKNGTTCEMLRDRASDRVFNSRYDGYTAGLDVWMPRCNDKGEFHEVSLVRSLVLEFSSN